MNMDCVGEGLALAIRAAKAGHDVRLWLAKENNPVTGDGFKNIKKVDNWLEHAKWAELIVPTGNHQFMPKLDMLRKAGINIFGPTAGSAKLEIDRAAGMAAFKAAGIEVPPYKEFDSLEAAEAHVRKTEERYVFKTMGDEDDKALSYVSKSPADMVARLQRWQKLKMQPKGPVMLQTFVPGIEMGVSRWMGSEGFVGPYNENFEFKKLLSGNCGPNCGEAGTVMKYVAGSVLGDEVLEPLEKQLIALGHTGDVDINVIINEKGEPLPLEFTTRLGWPAANIMWASHQGDPVAWMRDALEGKDSLKVNSKTAVGIVLAQPDYPYSKVTKPEVTDVPIYGVTDRNEQYLSAQSVKRAVLPTMDGAKIIERDIWATSGDYILVVTGHGRTVRRAADRAYGTLKELSVSNAMYRDDIGEKLEEELPKLHAHGYATEFLYE